MHRGYHLKVARLQIAVHLRQNWLRCGQCENGFFKLTMIPSSTVEHLPSQRYCVAHRAKPYSRCDEHFLRNW